MKCQAETTFADGTVCKCSQTIDGKPAESGLPVCYYHDDVALGRTTPSGSNFPEEQVAFVSMQNTHEVLYTDEGSDRRQRDKLLVAS